MCDQMQFHSYKHMTEKKITAEDEFRNLPVHYITIIAQYKSLDIAFVVV